MWPFLTAVSLIGLGLLHLQWKKRCQALQKQTRDLGASLEELEQAHLRDSHRSQAEQQVLFNSMLEGFLLLDNTGSIQTVNQALERLFDLKIDVRGKTIMEAFRLNALADLVDQVRREGLVRGYELDLPGVQSRSVEVNAAAVLDQAGKQQGIILIFHDLTRLKQLENTRREFVANVSHELRTPLSLIKGYVETLIDGAKDEPAVATRFLQTIEKHADRLTFLIEDLLTISKLESGQVVMNLQASAVHPLVERVLDDLQSKATERQVHLRNETPSDLVAHADSERIEQVLFNLIDNSIKYGKQGGAVAIQARAKDAQMIEISVRDDGPGIPPEARERIFERFYRVDRARSREQGGTGLGLSIVKHIVQSHGGEVWVESEHGKGAAFSFTLPLFVEERPVADSM